MMDNRRQSGLWDQNAQGVYERKPPAGPFQYYQPPSSSEPRRSFSQRAAEATPKSPTADGTSMSALKAATQNGLERSISARKSNTKPQQRELGSIDTSVGRHHALTADARHINELARPETYSDDESDSVPDNLRSKAWSPAPLSPVSPTIQANALPIRHASNASEHIRRGSVPDRSPLQNLEAKLDNISKEEKRARVEEAERRARQGSQGEGDLARSTTLHTGKVRIVPDGSRKANDGVKRDDRQATSAGALPGSPMQRRESGSERFHRASNALRSGLGKNADADVDNNLSAPPVSNTSEPMSPRETGIGRSQSQRYQHRARDAGFAGAAAAIAGASAASSGTAAARGKAAHERRKSQTYPTQQAQPKATKADTDKSWGPALAAVPTAPRRPSQDSERPKMKRLQKPPPTAAAQPRSSSDSARPGTGDSRRSMDSDKRLLQGHRMGPESAKTKASVAPLEPDIISKADVKTGPDTGVPYQIPPQTAAARQAKERVSFAPDVVDPETDQRHMLGVDRAKPRGYQSNIKPLDEWRGAQIAKLTAAQLALDDGQQVPDSRNAAWWEKRETPRQSSYRADEPYQEEAVEFNPPLYLKCGPLLRFTGLRRSQKTGLGSHSWRGSVMIVTEDNSSDLRMPPVLRLFAQPSDLYQRKPHTSREDNQHDSSDHEDPVAGQIKTSRTGRPIYVRPVHDIRHGVDLSKQENNNGLYTASRPIVLGQQASTAPDGKQSHHVTSQNTSRIKRRDGEKLRKYQDIRAHRLHVEHGCTFWRFNLEVELGARATRIAYRINRGPAIGFWVPGRGETMNIMFHSCNGFSLAVDPADFCGPDPLWRDVLNRHQSRPFHVLIGGGDQIYNDAVVRETTHFKQWLQIKNPEHKHHADFTMEMQEELESFYFNRYAMWFSQGLFSMANAQIPMVNIYDDHDIIDGFGSYPHHFMSSPVFTGLGAIAFKYYMLFQHQSLPMETTADEPSWVLGASPGPYINELNRSIFVWLGEKVALLAMDCRTERMRDDILSQESYDIIFDRCRHELVAGDTKHLILLLGVPIAYPRLNFLENILTSRLLDPIKALGRTGALGGFVNKFDGGVEILDDLDDHWTAKHHKAERNWFIQELQELAAEKSVRVTILGGDVHLGAVGQFYSNRKLGIPKDKDHRYMPNVISSAIVNTPPPAMMADVLNKRNKVHHFDKETDEDMIPMFSQDVDGSARNNKHLLPRRNFAMIREYMPGSTPPPSPTMERHSTAPTDNLPTDNEDNRQYPPGSIRRNMSLTRGSGSLLRRLSSRGKNPPVSFTPIDNKPARPLSYQEGYAETNNDPMQRSNSMTAGSNARRPSLSFHRRPTNLSLKEARKAAAKGGPQVDEDNMPGHINLEHGLDISLCMEVDQHDPLGQTEPYRLLVPALWYDGLGDENHSELPARRPSLFKRITGGGRPQNTEHDQDLDHGEFYGDVSRPDSPTIGTGADFGSAAPAQSRNKELEDLQATAASAGRETSQRHEQHRSAFHQRGYDLGAPPLGAPMTSARYQDPPQQETHIASDGHNGDYADGDSRSFTESEVDSRDDLPDEQHEQQRPQSKAERFFGIGLQGRQQQDSVSRQASGKRRSMWMPWKFGSRSEA